VNELGLPIVSDEFRLQMVGGEETIAALAAAEIEWLGEIRPVLIIVKEDYLLGTQLLKDIELIIDYQVRTLRISR